MKNKSVYIGVFCAGLLIIEIFQFRLLSSISDSSEDGFLQMVYENQVYQSSSTDGLSIVNPIFLSEIVSRNVTQPVLVLRYSGLSCKTCVHSCINALRRQCSDYETNSRILIVVSESASFRDSSNILRLEEDRLGYDLEDTRIPHFFVYNPLDQEIIHTFIPEQSEIKALNIYLSTIIGRYGI